MPEQFDPYRYAGIRRSGELPPGAQQPPVGGSAIVWLLRIIATITLVPLALWFAFLWGEWAGWAVIALYLVLCLGVGLARS